MTYDSLRDLLAEGYRATDVKFVANMVEHMSRTVYLMAEPLAAEGQYKYLSSRELQRRIDQHLRNAGVKSSRQQFNPVHWFSEQWTLDLDGRPTTRYFTTEYRELFDRAGKQPTSYRINPDKYESVVRILAELHSGDLSTAPAGQFNPETDPDAQAQDEAQRLILQIVALRQGQPQFRAALLAVYEGRCAVTGCDAEAALEAAHIKPYEGVATNVLQNGLLLRADIHTLFDFELIAIDPDRISVCVANRLRRTVYGEFQGRRLRTPRDPSARPDIQALTWRWKRFLSRESCMY